MMKTTTGRVVREALLLLTALLLLCACSQKPQDQILGTWMDSTGTQGYTFQEDGRVRIIFYQFSVKEGGLFSFLSGLLNLGGQLLDGTYEGSYTMDTENETVKITYTIYTKTSTKVYRYAFDANGNLTLNEEGEGSKSTTYFLQDKTTSDTIQNN